VNILVVGGAGYVGGAVVTQLRNYSDCNVRVFDSLLYEDTYRREVPFILGDVRDRDALRKALDGIDAVIWLAAIVGDGACTVDPEVTRDVNYRSLRTLRDLFDGQVVFTTTCSVYGANQGILTEESEVSPLSLYAETKLRAEEILADRALMYRFGTLFGVGDQFTRLRLDLVVNTLTARACTQGHIKVFGGDQYRPLLHVQDAARMLIEGAYYNDVGTYNLHSQNVRIVDLAHQVRNHFEDLEIESEEMSFEDSRNYRVSSQRARDHLGFEPVKTIDDGILEVRDIVMNRIKDADDPRYSNHGFLLSQVKQSQ